MKSELLNILKHNGTGVLKGTFRSDISSPEHFERLAVGSRISVALSKNEKLLGIHYLWVKEKNDEKGFVECYLLNNDNKPHAYKILESSGKIKVYLMPFNFDLGGGAGKFIAIYPTDVSKFSQHLSNFS